MRASLGLVVVAGCSWSTFGDLADQTWAHSQQKPDLASSDYAVAIAGASVDSAGGLLAVVSNGSPNLSTLVYDAKGGTSLGSAPLDLGTHSISALVDQPILISDGAGKIALVEKATSSTQIAVVIGPPGATVDAPFASTVTPPDAATFAGATLVVAAGPQLFLVDGTSAKACTANDAGSTPITGSAALASDATTLWVWTKTGALLGYSLATLRATCTAPTPTPVTPTSSGFATASFAPGTAAMLRLVGNFAILAGHAATSTTGLVAVVDLSMTPPAQVGTTFGADGLRSATVAAFPDAAGVMKTYVVLGFPNRSVDGTVTGQVEIHALDPATGVFTASPAEILNQAQPTTNELFGRAVTTMTFNGKPILVVAASNEIFAYYQTTLYPAAR